MFDIWLGLPWWIKAARALPLISFGVYLIVRGINGGVTNADPLTHLSLSYEFGGGLILCFLGVLILFTLGRSRP